MNYLDKKQVFFDRTRRRGKFFAFFLLTPSLFFLACFIFTARNIFYSPSSKTAFSSAAYLPDPPGVAGYSSIKEDNVFTSPSASLETFGQKRLAYYVNWDEKSFLSLEKNIFKIDTLIAEWLHLGEEGKVIVDNPAWQEKTLKFIRQNRSGLPVFALINNYDGETQTWDGKKLETMLGNSGLRSKNIEDIFQFADKNGLSGISIDYENINPAFQPHFRAYMQELYARFHSRGLNVTVNIPLSDPDFDAKILSQYCDQIILMAYDENDSSFSVSGPIASESWIQSGIKSRLAEAPAEKYIVSLGSYGYDWPAGENAETVDFGEIMIRASSSKAKIGLDKISLNPNFSYTSGQLTHNVWFLDAASFFNQKNQVLSLGKFSGIALWRMGSEDPGVWNFFGEDFLVDKEATKSLKYFNQGYGAQYEGKGEIFSLSAVPLVGQREIFFNESRGMITQESVNSFPSGFLIDQAGGEEPQKISLSFDDGPDEVYTPRVLDILKKYNIKASFFIIGLNASAHPEILERIHREGHEIGIHTFTHPELSAVSESQYEAEIMSTERLIESVTGSKTRLFRPPYLENVAAIYPFGIEQLKRSSEMGYYTVGVGIDPKDWSGASSEKIVSETILATKEKQGNIILLHDGGGKRQETLKALPKIIDGLKNDGYQFVSLAELMGKEKSEIMPALSLDDLKFSRINSLSFSFFSWSLGAIQGLFYLGVVLASVRIIFIAVLAEIQIRRSRKRKKFYREYKTLDNFSASVVIPAYNEEKVILKTIHSLFSSVKNGFDIIVVDDGSTDNTFDLVEKEFGKNPRVKLYRVENGGKANALNYGISQTKSDIIITLDADTVFRWDTIKKLVRRFGEPSVGAVAGNSVVGNQINLITRWQALEYITNQNFDKRAFEIVNAITVVPGSVGAWRRKAVIEAGGFSNMTLAEDADLTFSIIRNGWKVVFEEEAVGYTESPDTIRTFLRQRFRWMYGTLQAAWKNIDLLLEAKFNGLTLVAIPNVVVFQVFFSLISPFMDLALILSIAWAFWQKNFHPNDFSATFSASQVMIFYLYFTLIDFLSAFASFLSDPNRKWKLLWLLPLQRFFYRQLLYITAIRSLLAVANGKLVSWGKLERKNTVEGSLSRQIARL